MLVNINEIHFQWLTDVGNDNSNDKCNELYYLTISMRDDAYD